MVLKGYFDACAAAVAVSALKTVDLPTLERPRMPHVKPMTLLYSLYAPRVIGSSMSSPRKRGPIFQRRWLWVPAFAGTTARADRISFVGLFRLLGNDESLGLH